jgi:hypothetical protein
MTCVAMAGTLAFAAARAMSMTMPAVPLARRMAVTLTGAVAVAVTVAVAAFVAARRARRRGRRGRRRRGRRGARCEPQRCGAADAAVIVVTVDGDRAAETVVHSDQLGARLVPEGVGRDRRDY